ncbi:hypothetical protein UT300012_21420 [Paraclostridium bifermentans]
MEDEKTLRNVRIIESIRQMTPLNLDVVLHKSKAVNYISIIYKYEELLEISYIDNKDKLKVTFGLFNIKEFNNLEEALEPIREYISNYDIAKYSRSVTTAMLSDKYRVIKADAKDIGRIEVRQDDYLNKIYFKVTFRGVNGIYYCGYSARFVRRFGTNKLKKHLKL